MAVPGEQGINPSFLHSLAMSSLPGESGTGVPVLEFQSCLRAARAELGLAPLVLC